MVDDEPASRRLLRQALQPLGFAVDTCANGTDALRIIESGLPISWSSISRFRTWTRAEICAQLRPSRGRVADLPIILPDRARRGG